MSQFKNQNPNHFGDYFLELEETIKILKAENLKMTESLKSYSKYSPEALEKMQTQQVMHKIVIPSKFIKINAFFRLVKSL